MKRKTLLLQFSSPLIKYKRARNLVAIPFGVSLALLFLCFLFHFRTRDNDLPGTSIVFGRRDEPVR